MAVFNIKIVSDVVCPFCYIGKKRLERAISVYKKTVPGGDQDTFNISWHPFYLDPTSPNVGIPIRTHIARKFGPERVPMMQARMVAMGEPEGINFTWGGKIGNTRNAHRLVQLAKTKSTETEDKVMTELFKSYFEGSGDVTSQGMLVDAGEKAGLNRAEIKTWLDEGKGGEEVDREVEEAYAKGISGVPDFTINDRYQVHGAQDVEAFLIEFVRAKDSSSNGSAKSGKGFSC
ncbi:DSBA-like thioredoxin domain-containing protein [Lasiosphaeria hispida]|uniref:DSBA-like thioredoxin domain-containing protein n=1 Tax=Lasiosphaeria hispida TaxID=260671 RepID=A0AAJ0HCH3_9PEZI|nr:DSBA-like thioredoxin domain-containing protein [Lasiosphaeria hispida]